MNMDYTSWGTRELIERIEKLEQEKKENYKSILDLIDDFTDALDERIDEIEKSEYQWDLIDEIIDSNLPIYTNDALLYAQSDLWLAMGTPEIEAKNAYEMIVYSIAERLREEAQNWYNENFCSTCEKRQDADGRCGCTNKDANA